MRIARNPFFKNEVDQASRASNRLVHVPEGFAHGQLRVIPSRAAREVIVNGVIHRDWLSPQPTAVEHTGDMLTVTSPGGFLGGITPDNIITHPAVPRYRSLAEAMATLRLGEREGIGVDRMVRDMLAIGRPEPRTGWINTALISRNGDEEPRSVQAIEIPKRALSFAPVIAELRPEGAILGQVRRDLASSTAYRVQN